MTECRNPPPLLFPLPGNEDLARKLADRVGAELGEIEMRRFPDEETYVRFITSPSGRSIGLVCTLDRPDPKFLPLIFAASAARQLGAKGVGLIAPYLSYMRQDKSFRSGEAVTSAAFAGALSREIDWLTTVDPHLHRYQSLDAIYSIPSSVIAAAPALAEWIRGTVERPLLVGPDIESEQWVSTVADLVGAPYRVLRKERFGDRDVRISLPAMEGFSDRTPVLVDDIVSSAQTMIETARQLRSIGLSPSVCIAVHALFVGDSFAALAETAKQIVTTNTVAHPSNAIDISGPLAAGIRDLLHNP
ncbi:ribose-phosphate pyrophosphokinase [Ensifer sesbaniae]|uniref:ribose-phosphate pyrophosphokinase n=1 Tax=Ensifer sesbaniae TaxID=1214071 RepID=UPI00156929AF|nr:ribose-phosphate pyrophosphokinase [Ensifer sesbaniae]MCK3780964.1 ribose-phosphate pyrophosphokinase [Ensifer sesbaniae]NRQ12868.1 Ribose-phosphate pyrophosphokinase [Ensifer sesbaniae]